MESLGGRNAKMNGSKREQPFFTSRKEAKRYIAESLPLQDAMVLGIVPPEQGPGRLLANTLPKAISLVWLDMSKRPALRDLGRVHMTEGEGEAIFSWVYIDEDKDNCYFVLNVDMKKPVRETFRFPIRMQEWAALVEVVSTTGSLSILAGPPVAWRQLIKTMKPEELLQMIYGQAGGEVTLEMDNETVAELRRHYEAWKQRGTLKGKKEENSTTAMRGPVTVIESLISWNIQRGTCQGCHQPNQQLSLLELYLPVDLYTLLLFGKTEEAKYTAISGITSISVEQVRDHFPVSRTQLLCGNCLKRAFAGFTKKDTYETTKRAIEQEMKQQKRAWSAIFYCLFLSGTTEHEMLYQSNYTHIAASGIDPRPSLHDLLTIGYDTAKKQFSKQSTL
jgi:hypothetical protein